MGRLVCGLRVGWVDFFLGGCWPPKVFYSSLSVNLTFISLSTSLCLSVMLLALYLNLYILVISFLSAGTSTFSMSDFVGSSFLKSDKGPS